MQRIRIGASKPYIQLTKKQLITQCSNVPNRQLLSQVEIDEVQQHCCSEGEPGGQVSGEIPSPNMKPGRH